MRNSVVSLLFGAKLIGGIGKFIVIKGLPDPVVIVNNCGTSIVERVLCKQVAEQLARTTRQRFTRRGAS